MYSLASALIFGKIFFPGVGASAGTVASLATLAIGFLARPLGGLFFGALGDRWGHKWVLMITIALMGGSSTLIGVLPTAAQVGSWHRSCWWSCASPKASVPVPSRPAPRP